MLNYDRYIDFGYFEDGYVFSPYPVVLSCGDIRVDLRSATRRGGNVRVMQPEEFSAGAARFGYDPRAVLYTVEHGYDRLSSEEAAALEALQFASNGSAFPVSYYDARTAAEIEAWLEPDLEINESAPGRFSAALKLFSTSSPIPLPSGAVAPTILSGSTVLTRQAHPGSHAISRKQPRRFTSDGSLYIHTKSAIVRHQYSITLKARTYAELAAILLFFVNSAAGIRRTFPWSDHLGNAHSVRFASSGLSWQQSPGRSSCYDLTATLEEDL